MINDDQQWWISGGYGYCTPNCAPIADSVLHDGTSVIPFMSLPEGPDDLHHMIRVNGTHVIYLGGSNVGNAGCFDLTSNSWTPFTPIPTVSTF